MIVYTARHVLPVSSPPIADAAVAVHEDRIVAVGRRAEVLRSSGSRKQVRDLGDAVLLPGLVNAHVHVELSWARPADGAPPPGGSFMGWLRDLLARRDGVEAAFARTAAERAVAEMVSRGTVAIGDVANDAFAAAIVAASPLRGVLFQEVLGFRIADAESIVAGAAARVEQVASDPAVIAASDRLSVVLTPHAPHSTSAALLKALAGRAAAAGGPLSIHVAETDEEDMLLRDGSGPFVEFLRERGAWDEGWHAPGLSPVEYLDRLGLLTPRTLCVHCVHVAHQDLSKLQARGVTVVTCPRSNKRLGVGRAPVGKLLASGIPVALGTDSLASAPDLDPFEELASLRDEHPGLAPAAALRIATLNGAAALGLGKILGSIEVGKLAEIVAIPLEHPDHPPLEVVTSGPPMVRRLLEATAEERPA